jgi:hypothetical protein
MEKKDCKKCFKLIKNCNKCLKKGLERRYQIYLESLTHSLDEKNQYIIKILKQGINDCEQAQLCWYCFD